MPHRSDHRPYPAMRAGGVRRRWGVALALAGLLAGGALPATAAEGASPVVITVTEGVDRTAGTATICLEDWDGANLWRWDRTNQVWVSAGTVPQREPGCHDVEWDLGLTQAEHAGRYLAMEDPRDLPLTGDDPGHFDVYVRLAPAVVDTHPADAVVTAGETGTFAAAALPPVSFGGPRPQARWQTSTDGTDWAPVEGVTGDTLALRAADQVDSDSLVRAVYSRTPWNPYQIAPADVPTDPARLTGWAQSVLERDPVSVVADAGEQVTFDVGQVWGISPVALSWEYALPGEEEFRPVDPAQRGPSLTAVAGIGYAVDGVRFRLQHSNAFSPQTGTSGVATLTVLPAPAPPEVTTDPVSVRALPGQHVVFTAEATGAETVRWESRPPGGDWVPIAGADTGRLEVTAHPTVDGTQFRAVFGNTAGDTETGVATLTLWDIPPVELTVGATTVLVDRLPGW